MTTPLKHVYLLCAPSFSGKTTLAKKIAQRLRCAYIGLDEINARRGLEGGFDLPQEEWARTHQMALVQLEDRLGAGENAVIDDTNCFRFLRDNYRQVARRHGCACLVVAIKVEAETIWQRLAADPQEKRRRGVDDEAMRAHIRDFEWPDADEETLVYTPAEDADAWIAAQLEPEDNS